MNPKLVFLLWLFPAMLSAAPYNGEIMSFKQPDGTLVDVKLYGSEYYMRAEGLDNCTVIRDPKTGWICYAVLSEDSSEFISTGTIYRGKQSEPSAYNTKKGIPLHLDLPEKAKERLIRQKRKLLEGKDISPYEEKMDPHPVIGNIKGLCIVVDFSDEPATVPIEEFDSFCNDMDYSNYGNNGSVRRYFYDISGGLVDYRNVVYGYFRAPKTFAAYDTLEQGDGAAAILDLALHWIDSQGFDFSTLSLNSDSSIQAINLVYTGLPRTWGHGMWWHKGTYEKFSADGVHSGAYNCSAANDPLYISTLVHENGHMIGKWGDTYKYTDLYGPDGIGTFDLMCNTGNRYNPVPPNPFFRMNAGWGKVVDITGFKGEITDTAEDNTMCIYRNVNDTTEFFLLENRSKTGRSAYIPDEGLTIWHIDRMGDNQSFQHEVYLVHADNNTYSDSDICFRQELKSEFSENTEPGSRFYDGNISGLIISDISTLNPVMTYSAGPSGPEPYLLFSQVVLSDDNRNGFLEPGESATLSIDVSNAGISDAGNLTLYCSAPENETFVMVENPSQFRGSVAAGQNTSFSYNITLSPETGIGLPIVFRFDASADDVNARFDKTFITGEQIRMKDQQVITCLATFYDNGGYNRNYTGMKDQITTFLAPEPGAAIRAEFLSFEFEEHEQCGFDYLKIYNGPTTDFPLIGTFCGNNSPGTVVSTDGSGALTFQFHSDEAVTGTGWEALITCSGITSLRKSPGEISLVIYPNPTSDVFFVNIRMNDPGVLRLVLLDANGKTAAIYEVHETAAMEIDSRNLPDGTYYLQLWREDELITMQKLVLF